MIKYVRLIIKHYQEIIVYLIVGVITTIVGWGAKFLWNAIFYSFSSHPSNIQNIVLSTVNWLAGIMFAYPANRKRVFKSTNPAILKEASEFVASRVATWGIDILTMQILGNLIGINVYNATIISAVIVVSVNYLISKLIVFKKG